MDELREKLGKYNTQLQQVEALLLAAPTNEQLLTLRGQLLQGIAVTEGLIAAGGPQETAGSGSAAVSEKEGEGEKSGDKDEDDDSLDDSPRPGGAQHESEEAFSVGSRVEALSNERWYPAVITKLSTDAQTFTIEYIGFGAEDTKTLAMLRLIKQPPPTLKVLKADAVKGFKCSGLYTGDQNWYDCVIESVTAHGYKIVFPQYGNREEVPLEYLRRLTPKDPAADLAYAQPVLPKAALNEDGTFKIPDNLKPLPTDTDAEKIRKKAKVKSLKSRYRLLQANEETNTKQNSWKAFATSAKATKRVIGTMKGVRKESIFKSPEGTDGKVGVVGSGKGLTEFESKKRYKRTLP